MSNEARFEFVLVDQSGQPTRAGGATPPPMPQQPVAPNVITVQGPQGDRLATTPAAPTAQPRATPTAPSQPAPTQRAPAGAAGGAAAPSGTPGFSTDELAELLGKTPEEVQAEFGLPDEPTPPDPVDKAADRQQRRQERDDDRQQAQQQRARESFLPRKVAGGLAAARAASMATGVAMTSPLGLAAGAAAAGVAAPFVAAGIGTRAAERMAPGLAEVNAEVAGAVAMRDVQDVLNRIRTGETLGGATAEVLTEMTAIGASVTEIRNLITGEFLNVAIVLLNLAEEPLEALGKVAKYLNDNPELMERLKMTIQGPGPRMFWKAVSAISEWIDNDKAQKDTNLLTWFNNLQHILPSDWEGSRVLRDGFTAERPGFGVGGIGAPPAGFGVGADAPPMMGGL